MRQVIIDPICSPEEARQRFAGLRPDYQWAASQSLNFVRGEDFCCRDTKGKLVAMLLTDMFSEEEQAHHWEIYKDIKGSADNRPEIFGTGARQPRIRKTDGLLSKRVGVPTEVAKAVGGAAVVIGPYRYKNPAPGVVHCDLTKETKENPARYLETIKIGEEITLIFREVLPEEYIIQMAYINTVPERFKMPGTAYSSACALRDIPTAFHIDEFDIREATGCITACGEYEGQEFTMPEFGLALDLQPSDILFCDVHRTHGNLPRRSGHRVSQVWFVRRGMHECQRYGAVPLHLDF